MRIGIFGGDTAGRPLDDVIADARRVEAAGFASYGIPQIFGMEALAVLALVGREVPRIELSVGVVPIYPRHPSALAQQALTTQAATGNRLLLGIGLSHQIVVEGMWGMSYAKPLRQMREYLAVLMPLLRGEGVQHEGEVLTYKGDVTVAGAAAPPVCLAALAPKMLELAGTVADGTMTWMTGPATLADHTIPTITKAAEAAGRPAPRVVVSLPVCVTDDPAAARERANRDFQVYGFLPSYRAMLDREGASGPGDVAIVGTAAEVQAAMRRLADIGVTDFGASIFGDHDARARTADALQALL